MTFFIKKKNILFSGCIRQRQLADVQDLNPKKILTKLAQWNDKTRNIVQIFFTFFFHVVKMIFSSQSDSRETEKG